MKKLVDLNLKKRLIMRPYQETIVLDIISKFGINKPYVLGSCPSSGKTEMAIEALIRLLESGKINRVLILAHSTNVLKENFYKRLIEYFNESDIAVMRGQKDYNYDSIIQVMIPQNIKHVKGKFDLIITDEAQHNVLAEDGNYGHIVEMVEPKFQLLLTGTPSKFVRQNDLLDTGETPYHINCAGMDMIGLENFHNVRFDLIKSAYGFTNDDYNRTHDLTDINFSFKETETTINNVIIGAVKNIALRAGINLPKNPNFILEGQKLIQSRKFGKTLIMCRNIEQANQIAKIISNLFKVRVEVSQSKNDTESINLDKFKNNEFDFLCVVNRAREGYDDKKIVNLIDITMTHNIDLIYQMFCRVVRLDATNPNPKLYLKVTSNAADMPEYTLNIMTAALMLGSTENLSKFNGFNFRNIVMPRIERDETEEEIEIPVVNGIIDIISDDEHVIRRRNISDLMALDLIHMFSPDIEKLIHGNERYAMTTLGESLDLLIGDNFYNNKEGYFTLIRNEKITSADNWGDYYKSLSERDGVKYHSAPHVLFNISSKDFFAECYPENELYADKEGYFKIMRNEKITGAQAWTSKYKILSERDGVKYALKPWRKYGLSEKDFFTECNSVRETIYDNREGYIALIRTNNITTTDWIRDKIYKNLSERDGVKYHSTPWRLWNQTQKEFFDECHKVYNGSKEDYFKLFKAENISGQKKWTQEYKKLSKKHDVYYISEPWITFGLKPKEFFDECYGEQEEFYNDKEGYFKLMQSEKITSGIKWGKVYKELSIRDNCRYHSTPWRALGLTDKQFFDECYPKREIFDNKEGYFKILRRENINSSNKWSTVYKTLCNKDSVKYTSNPWYFYGQTPKQFFDEYRTWLLK